MSDHRPYRWTCCIAAMWPGAMVADMRWKEARQWSALSRAEKDECIYDVGERNEESCAKHVWVAISMSHVDYELVLSKLESLGEDFKVFSREHQMWVVGLVNSNRVDKVGAKVDTELCGITLEDAIIVAYGYSEHTAPGQTIIGGEMAPSRNDGGIFGDYGDEDGIFK